MDWQNERSDRRWYRARRGTVLGLALAAAATAWILGTAPGVAEESSGPSNRLIHSGSPYLLQHAHNPVDWYPWGKEAFAKAKRENKLIFLSVGYSTCYWCHVEGDGPRHHERG